MEDGSFFAAAETDGAADDRTGTAEASRSAGEILQKSGQKAARRKDLPGRRFGKLTILAAVGLLCVTVGVLRMMREGRQNEELLKEYQRAIVNQLIDYVDLTLSEEFFDVRETLGNMIANPIVQEHEREALETGDFDSFAEHVNVTLLKSSRLICYCFGCSADRHMFGEVPPALLSDPDFLFRTEGEAEAFVVLDGNWYMSFRAVSAAGITYCILIDFSDYFNTFLPESTLHQNWIVLYDEKNHVFFQNHDNQPFMVSADREELEKRADGYTLIAGHTEKQEAGFDYYEYKNYDGDTVVNCLCTLPYRLTQNGFLSIGIAQGITAMNDVLSRSVSFLQPALVSVAGLLIILFTLLRVRTEQQMREAGMKVLETENELITVRNKLSMHQMQPHFLYNALASIREIILEDPEYASELLCDFTTHLRACIRGMSDVDQIPFRQELENIRAYLNIEKCASAADCPSVTISGARIFPSFRCRCSRWSRMRSSTASIRAEKPEGP